MQLKSLLPRKAFSIGTIPSLIIFLFVIILGVIFLLLTVGFTKGGITASIPNANEFTSSYMLDAMLGLAEWDGECGCLAKGVVVSYGGSEKQVVYPGLVPKERLDSMQNKCFSRIRKGSIIVLKDEALVWDKGSTETINNIEGNPLTTGIPIQALPVLETTNPLPETRPKKQYITYKQYGAAGSVFLVTAEPSENTYLKKKDKITLAGGTTHEIDHIISPPVCITSAGATETYLDPYWKPWKMEVTDSENGKKWEFGVTDCHLLRYCKLIKVNDQLKTTCDPYYNIPIVYAPVWNEPEERILAIDHGGVVAMGKAKFQLGECKIDQSYQVKAP